MNLVKIEDVYFDADRVLVIRPKLVEVKEGLMARTEVELITESKYTETLWFYKTPEEVYGIISKAIGQE